MGFDNAIEQGFDLLLDRAYGLRCRFDGLCGLRQTGVPCVMEHRGDQIRITRAGLQCAQHVLHSSFKIIAPDGLAVLAAAARFAPVIRMALAGFTFRPAGGQRFAAIAAHHKSPKREIGVQIDPGRDLLLAVQTVLDRLKGLIADDRRVMPLAP